ncbi:hypothetical protein [Streptomyces sp. NPDC096339]|uniref:hypothetical protein n=1 Tax=Streptomyces sp. NPDC096339 TaxID=3366086 RepID=UPI0038052658
MRRSKRSARPPRPRRLGALALLGGLVCLALAAAVLVGIPVTLAEERAYAAARPCPTAAPLPDEDCLREIPYTVVDAEASGGRSSGYRASLTNEDGRVRVHFFGGQPLAYRLRKGDRVTARVWRGEITAVSRQAVTQATGADPDGDSRWGIAFGLALAAGGLFGLWAGWWLLRHPEEYQGGRTRPLAVAGWILAGALALVPLGVLGSIFLDAPLWYRIVVPIALLVVAGRWLLPTSRHSP